MQSIVILDRGQRVQAVMPIHDWLPTIHAQFPRDQRLVIREVYVALHRRVYPRLLHYMFRFLYPTPTTRATDVNEAIVTHDLRRLREVWAKTPHSDPRCIGALHQSVEAGDAQTTQFLLDNGARSHLHQVRLTLDLLTTSPKILDIACVLFDNDIPITAFPEYGRHVIHFVGAIVKENNYATFTALLRWLGRNRHIRPKFSYVFYASCMSAIGRTGKVAFYNIFRGFADDTNFFADYIYRILAHAAKVDALDLAKSIIDDGYNEWPELCCIYSISRDNGTSICRYLEDCFPDITYSGVFK